MWILRRITRNTGQTAPPQSLHATTPHIATSNEGLVVGRPVRNAILRLIRGMNLRLHPSSVAPAKRHEKYGPNHPTRSGSSCNNAMPSTGVLPQFSCCRDPSILIGLPIDIHSFAFVANLTPGSHNGKDSCRCVLRLFSKSNSALSHSLFVAKPNQRSLPTSFLAPTT